MVGVVLISQFVLPAFVAYGLCNHIISIVIILRQNNGTRMHVHAF